MEISANDMLLDRLIIAKDGRHLGMVDNLELSDGDGQHAPVVTALLTGPGAFGPRLGGRLGRWWAALGTRLQPDGGDAGRIPGAVITAVDREGVTVAASGDQLGTEGLHRWLVEHFIGRIPGSGEDR